MLEYIGAATCIVAFIMVVGILMGVVSIDFKKGE